MECVQTSAPAASGWLKAFGRRIPGWERALAAWAHGRVGAPFVWGEADCALIGFEAFDLQTGGALAARHRGRYRSELGAMRYQLREGTDAARELEREGCVRIPPGQVAFGDWLSAERDGFYCLHIVLGGYSLSAWPDKGVAWCSTGTVIVAPGAIGYTIGPVLR